MDYRFDTTLAWVVLPWRMEKASSENKRIPEHHMGSGVNSTSYTLTKATQEVPALDRQTYTCCPWTLCLFTHPEGSECLEPINCGNAPNHFKNKHGIVNMGREVKLVWRLGATKDVCTSRPTHPGAHQGGMVPPYDTIRSEIMKPTATPRDGKAASAIAPPDATRR
ncbi:hypothetical protein EDD17DRAFT_1514453 [Pisolithus thermaeus]|nr:hypothetical protein EDD17DRAFT_1514453 [Pisolithus thermaeus]